MSTTNLYRVYKTTATEVAEYRNGWGCGPQLWGYLCMRYLGKPDSFWLNPPRDAGPSPLWKLHNDPRVPEPLRIAHAMTYEGAIISFADRDRAADALNIAHDIVDRPNVVNHFRAIAADLRAQPNRPRLIGFGVSCTSVCDPWSAHRQNRGQRTHLFNCVASALRIQVAA